MGEPLSVAASIADLLSLAGQLYTALNTFISNVKDAPCLAQAIQSEINSFRNSLNALSELFRDAKFGAQRGELIPAEHVVVTFTDAVLLFSQMESVVLPLTAFTEFNLGARPMWARRKPKLMELVTRLQWQKNTLVLQLSSLKCVSHREAEHSRRALDEAISQKLAKDQDMERRLQIVEERLQHQSYGSAPDDNITDNITVRSGLTFQPGNLTIFPASGSAANAEVSSTSNDEVIRNAAPRFEFENILSQSWVYLRNENREETMSFHSSVVRISAWSALSELSLGNVSIITVLALPIETQEMTSTHWYRIVSTSGPESENTSPTLAGYAPYTTPQFFRYQKPVQVEFDYFDWTVLEDPVEGRTVTPVEGM